MPRLLDYLNPIYRILASIGPQVPQGVFVAMVFLTVLAWRKLSPDTWRKYSKLIPVSDEQSERFSSALRKVWQALPSVLISAVYGALGTGLEVWPTVKLALLGLIPPILHEVGWRYEGKLGDDKPLDGSNGGARFTSAEVHGPGSAWISDDGKSAGGELRSLRILALSYLMFATFTVLLAAACSAAKNPCSEVTLMTIQAGCEARIERECHGNKDCPAYVECSRAIRTWRACP